MSRRTATAFRGTQQLATGDLREVARAVWRAAHDRDGALAALLIFDDETGAVVDLEMRGDERDMLAHLDATILARETAPHVAAPDLVAAEVTAAPRGRGRPRLGVVSREVTLLPRHWEWLAAQPGGASVALRRLVDDARRTHASDARGHASRDAAYQFMHAIAGDLENFEEATRALFRGDLVRFGAIIGQWPADVGHYAVRLAAPRRAAVTDTP